MNEESYAYETPFSDTFIIGETSNGNGHSENNPVTVQFENPFLKTFEISGEQKPVSPFAMETVSLLGELEDPAFTRNLYELASELEDSLLPLMSNETAIGENYIAYAARKADDYFRPLIRASDGMMDRIARKFGETETISDIESETFLDEFRPDSTGLSPVQEQFLGKVFNKVKSAVKAGVKAVGKILPVNLILGKLKGLIRPLLDRVLKFAIGKLPKNLQPYAQTLAKKLLNLEVVDNPPAMNHITPAAGDIDSIQTELDNEIARLVYTPDETEAEWFIREYESSPAEVLSETDNASLDDARVQLIRELSDLGPGQSPAPAIERFLPVAIMALKPMIKMGISAIGRPKVINFIAGLLAKLVEKYVPKNVVQPLATSIVDAGMKIIGFETAEMNEPTVGFEALVNTIEDTVNQMKPLSEAEAADEELLTLNLLEAFETAAVGNFPTHVIKEALRKTAQPGVWVLKPRKSRYAYKKYTTVFNATIDPEKARTVHTFRSLPLADFLRDKLGIDPSKTVQARVHLFESIHGTKLTDISRHEDLQGLNHSAKYSWTQLHPLTRQAAAVLINEPGLGRDFPAKFTAKRHLIATGQRFYYLEIDGARLRTGSGPGGNRPAHSNDVKAMVNLLKSSIQINYYFSEENAKTIVERLNSNDLTSALLVVKSAVKGMLQQMLSSNIAGKVKIIHETFPEMYMENFTENEGVFMGVKNVLTGLLEKLADKFADNAFDGMRQVFRTRAAEFRKAQAEPDDGVTIGITWPHVSGLSALRSLFSRVNPGMMISDSMLQALNPGGPEIIIKAGKHI